MIHQDRTHKRLSDSHLILIRSRGIGVKELGGLFVFRHNQQAVARHSRFPERGIFRDVRHNAHSRMIHRDQPDKRFRDIHRGPIVSRIVGNEKLDRLYDSGRGEQAHAVSVGLTQLR